MPPKKSAKPRATKRSKAKAVEEEEEAVVPAVQEIESTPEPAVTESTPMEMDVPQVSKDETVVDDGMQVDAQEDLLQPPSQPSTSRSSPRPGLSVQERSAKLASLRMKMRETATANRRDLIEETNRAKMSAKELVRLEKQQRLAEMLREKVDAQETGEDLERKRNWGYSIEENDTWTKRLEKKARRADFEFHDETKTAHRKYKKDLDVLKPDLVAYNRQKEVALGLEAGTLVKTDSNGRQVVTQEASSSTTLATLATMQGDQGAELLYRDANSLLYADNRPSEEAIDRVVSKLNNDLDKRSKWSRRRPNEDEGDITYINERNKVFNKKIARFYDKYTTEIRASFERGTAV